MSATGTEARVCADIATRQALGIAKYGTTVAENPLPLRAWLEHHYQELLDAAVYVRRAIEEMDKPKSFKEAAAPLVEWLRANANPHCIAMVDQLNAELLEGREVVHFDLDAEKPPVPRGLSLGASK